MVEDPERYAAARPDFRRDLGGGLVQRWSTAADAERIAHLAGMIWRGAADAPPNPRVVDALRRQLRGDFPFMGSGDCALVEDTSRPGSPLIACTCLWHREWAYAGIPFPVGQLETVATDPDYRNRGLARTLIAMAHARSASDGHLVQIINGIPAFYRQFGYEYALDFAGRRVTYLSLIPPADEPGAEPCTLRPATLADIPQLMALANRRRATGVIWYAVPERYWRYRIAVWDEPAVRATPPGQRDLGERPLMIVDAAGATRGFLVAPSQGSGADLPIYVLELAPDANLPGLVPALLRALHQYGEHLHALRPSTPPLRQISFNLGRAHPVYDALGPALAPFAEPPYAWYIRVPELPTFLRHITPALERRLAGSAAAGYSGALTLDFYRGGLSLHFAAGKLVQIVPWRVPPAQAGAQAGFPGHVFLQVLFGYRSLVELRHAFPDVWASDRGALLLDALFPARPSWVMPF